MNMNNGNEEFLTQFMPVQQSVYAYIRAAGFGAVDTDDVIQDVAVELMRSHSKYDPSRPYVGWAIGIARNLVYKKRRYDRVRSRVVVNSEICEKVSDHVASALTTYQDEFSDEKEYLEKCVGELPVKSRSMIRMRYFERFDIGKIGKMVGKSYGATNVLLSRIRGTLMECITAKRAGAGA